MKEEEISITLPLNLSLLLCLCFEAVILTNISPGIEFFVCLFPVLSSFSGCGVSCLFPLNPLLTVSFPLR